MSSLEFKKKMERMNEASMKHLHPPCYRVTQRVIEDPVDVKDFRGPREQIPLNAYYKAKYAKIPKFVGDPSRKQLKKDIQYCNGLSNYSNVLLGDERVQFDLSLSQEVYTRAHKAVHKKEAVVIEQLTDEQRRKLGSEYTEAISRVGKKTIINIEKQMRLKLNQRTKAGPFQLRNTFKYFDRDGSGGINFEEFKNVFDLLGLSFTETQQLAVFGTYDDSWDGEISYHEFIDKLMEKDFTNVKSFYFDEEAEKLFMEEKLHKKIYVSKEWMQRKKDDLWHIFKMIDKDKSGTINSSELELFMLALGMTSKMMVEDAIKIIDKDGNGTIDFKEFFEWWFTKKGYFLHQAEQNE